MKVAFFCLFCCFREDLGRQGIIVVDWCCMSKQEGITQRTPYRQTLLSHQYAILSTKTEKTHENYAKLRKSEIWENKEGETKERWGYWKKMVSENEGIGFQYHFINEGQLCCFVLLFLLNLFLTAQNINGFYFLDPDDVGLYGPYLYLFFFYLYSILEYYLKDFYVVLFCFSTQFVFDSTKHPRFLLFRSGWCWPISILYEHFGDKIPLHGKELRKKKMPGKLCIWFLFFTPYFNFVSNFSIVSI